MVTCNYHYYIQPNTIELEILYFKNFVVDTKFVKYKNLNSYTGHGFLDIDNERKFVNIEPLKITSYMVQPSSDED